MTEQQGPRVSVIVPARELTEDGRRCLSSLLELSEVEVIFVPDRCPPDLDPRVICLPSGEVPVGAKRQLALERASGDVVALIDDDAYPHPSWTAQLLSGFAEDPAIGAVCGPNLTPDDVEPLEQLSGLVYASPLVGGPHRWRFVPMPARDVEDAPSVNLAIRRELALAVRLDSPHYPGDDTIVCDRLIRSGRRIRYLPGAIVFHRRRPLWRGHLTQIWRFGRHRGSFARVYRGNSLRPSYFAPSALALGLLAGWIVPGRPRRLWRLLSGTYVLACVLAGTNRRPARWWRLSSAIATTHAIYGIGFLLGITGVPLPKEHSSRARTA